MKSGKLNFQEPSGPVQACNGNALPFPLRIRSYLKSAPIYTFLILYDYHSDSLYLREQGCEDKWLLFEAKRSPKIKKLGNVDIERSFT